MARATHGKDVLRELDRASSTRIVDVPDGARRLLAGTVALDGAPAVAGLTGRLCCAWAVTIDEVGMGDSVQRGVVMHGVPFTLRDASGEARVLPDRARIGAPGHIVLRSPRQAPLDRERALYSQLGVHLNYPDTSKLRFTERVILADEPVRVYGYCSREPDRQAMDAEVSGYRGAVPTRPVLSSTRRAPLLIG